MIFALGQGNDSKWLSKEFFWGYLYLAFPLENFNFNVINCLPNNSFGQFFIEIIPEIISNKFGSVRPPVNSPVQSLNISTAFVEGYRTLGMIGCYFILLLILLVSAFIIKLTYENNKDQMFPQMCGILYVMCMSIFTNPFYFSITGVMIFIMLFKSLKFGKN
ncbi:hypothetical protein [Lactobacillus helveticus]|uniref:Uncharacterized protein n=1 Tax=Lactobacillus helveticus TaxID=1587 RepID=A0A9Q5C0C9_LACHE|nr:hypothetical protein [Lactobacillus helveticus]NRO35287.1 hypothetical protein [Lactobacillus helveticus]